MTMPTDNASIFSSQTRSVYPAGLTFDLEDFSSRDFIVKEFIETLSDSAIPASSRRSQTKFDPKPLIRTFEQAQTRLADLSGDLEIKENELSAAARRAEAQHSQNVSIFGKKLRETIESFHQLDTSFNVSTPSTDFATGNMAVETGRRLEEIDRQRRRALDAHFLIECWDGVSNRGDLTPLETLRRSSSGEAKVRSAQIARQLLRISQRLDPMSWDDKKSNGHSSGKDVIHRRNTREMIEKFSETLEKDLLKQFDDFYRKEDYEGMKDCAIVLHDFNGGASVIALFVNQHQFFIDRSQLIATEEVGGESWGEKLADPDSEPPGVEQSLQSLIDEVRVVVQSESNVIKRAFFPYHEEVLGKFLQRVFQQSIQQRLEMVLDKANSVSSLAFLRSLQSSRNYVSGLVDALKEHGLTEHPEPISSQTAVVLDQQLEELFVPYFVGSSYIEREKKTLEDLYNALLFRFSTFHVWRKRAATAWLARSAAEVLSSASDAYVNRLEAAELAPTHRKVLLQVCILYHQILVCPASSYTDPTPLMAYLLYSNYKVGGRPRIHRRIQTNRRGWPPQHLPLETHAKMARRGSRPRSRTKHHQRNTQRRVNPAKPSPQRHERELHRSQPRCGLGSGHGARSLTNGAGFRLSARRPHGRSHHQPHAVVRQQGADPIGCLEYHDPPRDGEEIPGYVFSHRGEDQSY